MAEPLSTNQSLDAANPANATELTHVDQQGHARMVDVGDKPPSNRKAIAKSQVNMSLEAANAIRANELKKGDCIQIARIAAIQATKQTSNLIPLCHAIPISSVEVSANWTGETTLEWTVSVKSTGQTGVEMEALTGASVAALTVYDMCKAIDRSMTITNITLLEKTGGVRGNYLRSE